MGDTDVIAEALLGHRFHYVNEQEFQDGVWSVLVDAGLEPEREVRLGPTNRIDFVVGRVGVEVKIKGSLSSLIRQAMRYARCDALDALVVVTTVAKHRGVPLELNSKPVSVVYLGAGAL